MHYDNEKVLEDNRIEIVIYKHGPEDNNNEDKYQICSIRDMYLIHPWSARKFIKKYYKIQSLIDELEDKPYERYYQIFLRMGDNWNQIEVLEMKDVTNPNLEDHTLWLH